MEKLKHNVEIKCQNGKSLVIPGEIHVKRGDGVRFNAVNTDISLFMPRKDILESSESHSIRIRSIKSGHSKTLKVRLDSHPDTYTYGVYCKENNDFAEGNSSPKMIVEE